MASNSRKQVSQSSTTRAKARPYVAALLSRTSLNAALSRRLKSEPARVIDVVLGRVFPGEYELTGRLFPARLDELNSAIPTQCTERLFDELNWASGVLRSNSSRIATYLTKRELLTSALFAGEFELATEILNAVQTDMGVSWWLFEMRMLVEQRSNGLEANRTLLKKYQDETKSAWVRAIMPLLSQRCESGLSAEDYVDVCSVFNATESDRRRRKRSLAYLSFKLNFPDFRDLERIPVCLNIEESHSLIDRYNSFVAVTQKLASIGTELIDRGVRDLICGAAQIHADLQLRSTANVLQATATYSDDRSRNFFSLLNDYTLGRYDAICDTCVSACISNLGQLEFYELAAKSLIRSRKGGVTPFGKGSISESIFQSVFNVLCRNREAAGSLRRIRDLAYHLHSFPISPQLFAFYKRYSEDREITSRDRWWVLEASIATPRLATAMPVDQAVEYLENLNVLYPQNAAVELFLTTKLSEREGIETEVRPTLPTSRRLKHKAYLSESLKDFRTALADYRELERVDANNPLTREDATAGQYRCHLHLGEILESASILARVAAAQPGLVVHNTLRELLTHYPRPPRRPPSEWRNSIAWPILVHVAQREGVVPSNLEHLHDALDEFLTAWDVQKPTTLRPWEASFEKHSLVYVLANVCVPDVLDSSIWYDTQEELETERRQICEWLAELDPSRTAVYSAEVATIKSRSAMRELAHKVSQNKIYVDTEGVKSLLAPAFFDRLMRCFAYAHLDFDLRQGSTLVGSTDGPLKSLDVSDIDDAFRIFKQIFSDLRQQFLGSNEYGLDSNLSQRIRHGVLSGQIRSNYEISRLVTERSRSGEYQENKYWLDRLVAFEAGPRRAADNVLREFSRDVDRTVDVVRNRWIQIRGTANEGQGLFNYDFGDEDLRPIYERIPHLLVPESLIDSIFDCLWQRTEVNLSEIRSCMVGRLKDLLLSDLDRCEAALAMHVSAENMVTFRQAITNCKTQVDNGLINMADWFRVDHAQRMPSFYISVLIDALLEQTAKYCGPARVDVTSTITSDQLLQGRLFRPLWDVFFILFSNVSKHCMLETSKVLLTVDESESGILISLTNDLGILVDRELLTDTTLRIAEEIRASSDNDRSRREGGTGLFKIHKILKYDLRSEGYRLSFKQPNESCFNVTIFIPSGGLYADISRY